MTGLLRSKEIVLFLILYGIPYTNLVEAGVISREFTGLRGFGLRLQTEYVDQKIVSIDRIPCAMECVQRSNCRTISWNRQGKTCLLSSTDVTNGNIANFTLEWNVEWDTMSMMEYTVFGLTHSMTAVGFADADDLCNEQSTVIAAPGDLLYSQSLGFSYKKCCWLSDGSIGYVLQGIPGITYCDNLSNPQVICILN